MTQRGTQGNEYVTTYSFLGKKRGRECERGFTLAYVADKHSNMLCEYGKSEESGIVAGFSRHVDENLKVDAFPNEAPFGKIHCPA